jgi:hypothetical protein
MASRTSSDAFDRLLSGEAPEPDAHGSEVARLLAALRSPMPPDGAREQEAVSSFAEAVTAAPTRLADVRTGMRSRHRTARIAAATAAIVLLGGTAAAAATGSLPDGAQSAVAKALSHVSVDVPDPGASHPAPTPHAGAVGPDASGPAHRGLCTAWAARGKADADRGASGDSTAFANLRHAAHDEGLLVKDFCADVLAGTGPAGSASADPDPGQSGADHGQPGADPGQSGEDHGNGADPPAPVATPNGGGDGTGATASDGANQQGVDHAADAASQGSGNADPHGRPTTTTAPDGSPHAGG